MTNQLTLGVEEERPVMGLDIGSASIKCGVGVQGAGYYDIIAAKSVPSVGIRDGEIEDPAAHETGQEAAREEREEAGKKEKSSKERKISITRRPTLSTWGWAQLIQAVVDPTKEKLQKLQEAQGLKIPRVKKLLSLRGVSRRGHCSMQRTSMPSTSTPRMSTTTS